MTFFEVLLNVLAIIGIVAVGGFIVYFLGGLVLSILESRKVEQPQPKPQQEEQNQFVAVEYQPEQEATYEETLTDEQFLLDDEKVESVDYSKATEEKKSLNTEEIKEKEDIDNLFNDEKDFNFEDFDFDAFFNEQNEQAEEQQSDVAAVAETQSEEVEALSEQMPVVAESKTQENSIVETDITTETVVTETESALRTEIEALKAELAEQKRLYEELKAQADENQKKWEEEKTNLETLYADAEKRELENSAKSKEALSIEEYQARLEVLRERLKINEAELRANRKEFLPLKRVRKNLDKDKSKLRRREALVAKQKVLLYGVNNIMEIDQEKAKKLAEDLDLLDGLKVSVRHCEEVMEANKDRYPILETANRILVTTNEELKTDILACERAIRKLKGQPIGDDDSLTLEQIAAEGAPPKRKRGRPRKVQPENQEQIALVNVDLTQQTSSKEEVKAIMDEIVAEPTNVYGLDKPTTVIVEGNHPVADVMTVSDNPQTTTTISVKKEETTITTTTNPVNAEKKNTELDFDDMEPTMEELFEIENEALFNFDNIDDNK